MIMNPSTRSFILGLILAIVVSIASLYLIVFGRALSQHEDHLRIALALPEAIFSQRAVRINDGTYFGKSVPGFVEEMKQQGFTYVDQMGAGLFFEKGGSKYYSETHRYSAFFAVFTYPQR